jgi:hypothetical protein
MTNIPNPYYKKKYNDLVISNSFFDSSGLRYLHIIPKRIDDEYETKIHYYSTENHSHYLHYLINDMFNSEFHGEKIVCHCERSYLSWILSLFNISVK